MPAELCHNTAPAYLPVLLGAEGAKAEGEAADKARGTLGGGNRAIETVRHLSSCPVSVCSLIAVRHMKN